MEIRNCTALVTGANRGVGFAFTQALLETGAKKVYAGVRQPAAIADPRVVPVLLDVTSAKDIERVAAQCADVDLLVNNAGVMLSKPALADGAVTAFRSELEVNVLGLLQMMQAFAPVLSRNGGGGIVNMLSVVSLYIYPFNGTYGATKHAAKALTDAARVQLRAQGTHVLGVYAGFIDTDMAADVEGAKTSPAQVAARALEGMRQ